MKNILKVFVITMGIVLFVNVNSFALVDASVWGGGSFGGAVEGNSNADYNGWQYGVKAHYNMSLIPFIEMGIGAYLENSQYKDTSKTIGGLTSDAIKSNAYGLDANLILSIPVIHPYVRGTYAIMEKMGDDTQNFKAYGVGAGLELSVVPFFRIFGEYMYKNSEHDSVFTINQVNFGLKLDI